MLPNSVILIAVVLVLSVTLARHFLQLQLNLCVTEESRYYIQNEHTAAQRHYWIFGDRTVGGRGDADDLEERSRRRFEELLQLNASGGSPLESSKWKPVVLRICTPGRSLAHCPASASCTHFGSAMWACLPPLDVQNSSTVLLAHVLLVGLACQ